MDITTLEKIHTRRDLISLLEETPSDQATGLIERLKCETDISRGGGLKDVFHFLVNINLADDEAVLHWENILEHKRDMTESLGRDVGLRVAIFDYFLNITKLIRNPKVVEQDVFVSVLESAFKDPLTGLFNRRYLDVYLERQLTDARKHNKNLSVIFFDIDRFKQYNDKFGHPEGDRALRQIGFHIKTNIRENDLIMRYAGEEFVMVMRDTAKSAAIELGKRLKDKMEQYAFDNLEHFDDGKSLTVSGGVSTYPEDGLSAEDLIKKADMALYIAKRSGKNQIRQYLLEKRENPRKKTERPIFYSFSDKGEKVEMFGLVKNMCQDGVLFESTKEIPFGRDVEIKIDLPDSQPSLMAIGRVVRKSRNLTRDKLEIALAFTRLKSPVKSTS